MKARLTIEYIVSNRDGLPLEQLIENRTAAIDLHQGVVRNARVPGLKYPIQVVGVELEKGSELPAAKK